MSEGARRGIGYLALLRGNASFRHLWLAVVVSFFGDWFNTIALYAAVEELSGSAEAVSAVFVAKMLPIFLVTPIAGPLVDRFDRRKLLIGTDLVRAACGLGLVLCYRLESLWGLFAVLVVKMCGSGLFIPARASVIPRITAADQLGAANALGAGTWSAMLAFGAAIGGLVTEAVGIEAALMLDALTFLGSAVLLLPLPAQPPGEIDGALEPRSATGFVGGLRYLRRKPLLAAVITLKPGMGLTAGVVAMLPLFAQRALGDGGPGDVGTLFAARGVGALVGSLVVRRVFGDAPRTMRRLLIPAFALLAVSCLALSVAQTMWQGALCYFAATVGTGAIWVQSTTLGHLESDDAYRGRVFALEFGMLTLVMSGSAALGGALVERLGWSVRDVAQLCAALVLVPVTVWALALAAHGRRTRHERLNRSG